MKPLLAVILHFFVVDRFIGRVDTFINSAIAKKKSCQESPGGDITT